MATIKSHTDINQSKKLAEILPLESADMCWSNNLIEGLNYTEKFSAHFYTVVHLHTVKEMKDAFDTTLNGWDKYLELIPCWSLAALLDVIPEVHDNKPAIFLNDNSIIYPYVGDLSVKADNLIDACYEMILKLYEHKML